MIRQIEVNAPGYIELGSPWSRRAMFEIGQKYEPCTITMGVNKGVNIVLEQRQASGIELDVVIGGVHNIWSGLLPAFDFTSANRGLAYVLALFGMTQAKVTVTFDTDPADGFNLYTTAFLALAQACSEYGGKALHQRRLYGLVYDALATCYGVDPGNGLCGVLTGGIYLWKWRYPEIAMRPDRIANSDIGLSLASRMLFFAPSGNVYKPPSDIITGDGLMGTTKRVTYLNMLSQIKAIAGDIQNERWEELAASLQGYQAAVESTLALLGNYTVYKTAVAGQAGAMFTVDNVLCFYTPAIDTVVLSAVQAAWEGIGGHVIPSVQIVQQGMQ